MKDLYRIGIWVGSGVLLGYSAPIAYRAASGGLGSGDELICRILGLMASFFIFVIFLGLMLCKANCKNKPDPLQCTDRCIDFASLAMLFVLVIFGSLLALYCPPRLP